MDGGTRKGYAKLTSKNHIWNGLRTPWRRSITLHYLHICNLPNLALIGCYKFCINFPNVVKNYIFWQNSISLIWLLLSPKYDWRKVEFSLDYFRQSGFSIIVELVFRFDNLSQHLQHTPKRSMIYIWSASLCRDRFPRTIPDRKGFRKVRSYSLWCFALMQVCCLPNSCFCAVSIYSLCLCGFFSVPASSHTVSPLSNPVR